MQTGVLKHLFLNMYITISTSAAFTEKGEKYEKEKFEITDNHYCNSFSIAASLSLRRKGYRKSGFFIQFLAPAVEVIFVVLEYIL